MKLRCMFDTSLMIRLVPLLVMAAISPQQSMASVTFANAEATVMLGVQTSQISLANPTKILGWGEHSIVKLYGNNAASAWPESYQADAVIGQRGQTGVTAVAYTDLTDANSNAICLINRTTSAALLYGDRVNSGAIGYLTKFARANSGGVVYLTRLARTSSNTLFVGNRTTSNALLYGDRVNSGGVGYLTKFARTTSNALLYGDRVNSSAVVYSGTGVRATSNAVNAFYNNLAVPTTDSIDGTQFMRYHPLHHVFHNNGNAWSIRGWVRFNDGFTVMPRASVIMDTLVTVSGGFDLRETGTLILNNDLYLAHNVTLTNGGNIKGESSMTPGGQANTIFMGGDLTLASTTYARTLHITGDWGTAGNSGDLVIDGCGHTLSIEDRAQIFVDQNMTLTLRNMTIRTGPKSLMVPAIRLAAQGSKLALDNVMFDLGTDFQFEQGQIFIHDEVAVTGTSAFIYQSPMQSYIASGATWSFEQGTTFSVAPATYTDIPYTAGTTRSNNFIVHADASSALSLNGCSFQMTFTGLRLRSGMVLFDNKVAVDTTAGMSLVTTPTTPVAFVASASTSSGPFKAVFSPDGRFIAVACNSGSTLQIFRFNGNSKPTLLYTVPTLTNPCYLAWSPDGRFIAVPCITSSVLQIFSFTGNSAPKLSGSISITSSIYAAWSPDGKFLATANWSSGTTSVYRFSGVGAPALLGNITNGSYLSAVAWSPDGRYLAVTDRFGGSVNLFRFNGSTVPSSTPTYTAVSGTYTRGVSWTPDGRFLAVVNWNDSTTTFFSFNGTSNPVALGAAVAVGGLPIADAWSPDGRFLATANQSGNSISILRLNGLSAPTSVMATVATGSGALSVDWSSDGAYIAVASNGGNSLQIYRCNYYYTGQPAQGFSTGLLFGDQAKGVAYDTDVQILGNATVSISGIVRDDSV